MTTMVVEIYDALRSIGVAEDKATKAAEAMATLEPQFAAMRSEYRSEFAAVRSDLRVLTLRVNLVIAALVMLGAPALWLLVRVASKTGAIG
jgi:hypothetical protein